MNTPIVKKHELHLEPVTNDPVIGAGPAESALLPHHGQPAEDQSSLRLKWPAPRPDGKRHVSPSRVHARSRRVTYQREPRPGSLCEEFEELQRRMLCVHDAMRSRRGARSMVIVPSRAVDERREGPAETQAYEERLLCLLLMLNDPGLSVVYVTSWPIAPAIIDYYLSLLPPAVRSNARQRATFLTVRDRSTRPLTEKLLERSRVLSRIRWALPRSGLGQLVPYATTSLERELALALDIPMYGADPRLADFGTKSGARALFARAGVPHPLGMGRIRRADEAIDAIARLRSVKPDLGTAVLKLEDGACGDGNAVVDLSGLPQPGAQHERACIGQRLERMAPEAGWLKAMDYLRELARRGGVVEEWITGSEMRSPSVQLELTPAAEVTIVSTHDQLLGGPGGQRYEGCRFPAEPAYALAVTTLASKIGRELAGAGVIGRAGIDFVTVRDDEGRWRPYAIEINLRKGGTTHPFAILEQLTGGTYDAGPATFVTRTGAPRHYVATDHLEDPSLRRLGHAGVLRLIDHGPLGFDRRRGVGVVFHMLSALDAAGRAGLTAVGHSAADAQHRFEQARSVLLDAATSGACAPARMAAVSAVVVRRGRRCVRSV
jgi:hypothetical protein